MSCVSNNPPNEVQATFPSPDPSRCVPSHNATCAELPSTIPLTNSPNTGRSQESGNESNAIQGIIISSSFSETCPKETPYLVQGEATVKASQSPSKAYAGTWIIGERRIDAGTMAFDRTTTILRSQFCTSKETLDQRIQFWVNPKIPTANIAPSNVPVNNIVRWQRSLVSIHSRKSFLI